MILALQLASHPHVFGQTLTRLSDWIQAGVAQYDPVPRKNGTESNVRSQILADMIKPYSGCTLALIAITCCNQNTSESDPVCLLGEGFFKQSHSTFSRVIFKFTTCVNW